MGLARVGKMLPVICQLMILVGAFAPGRAEESFSEPISQASVSPKAEQFFQKGHQALDEKNVRRAEENYRKAIELNPHEPRYHRQLAVLLTKLLRGQEAEREALVASNLDPNDWRTMLVLGTIYHFEKRYDEEVELYRKVVKVLPDDQKLMKERLTAFINKDEEAVKRQQEATRRKKEAEEKQYKGIL